MIKFWSVQEIDLSADNLIAALLRLAKTETVCILDSCGVGHLGSHLLIAGIDPIEKIEISNDNPDQTLSALNEKLSGVFAAIFTISYDFGRKLLGIEPHKNTVEHLYEPDVFIARFDSLVVHDYDSGTTTLVGNAQKFESIQQKLSASPAAQIAQFPFASSQITSNFTKAEYLAAIGSIQELIRSGDTYQTNLTQRLAAKLPDGLTPEIIFSRLRRDHPAPFASFIKRLDSTVVSASPECFFRVEHVPRYRRPTVREGVGKTKISTSPIKGTRPRGRTAVEDAAFRNELLTSEKDRAENTMIVDLLRNDLSRIAVPGSVQVEAAFAVETYPTLHQMVSTVRAELAPGADPAALIRALFPCGSITGAPKIRAMELIAAHERDARGAYCGAIGRIDPASARAPAGLPAGDAAFNVAIRSLRLTPQENSRGRATLGVGSAVVADSEWLSEWRECLLKGGFVLPPVLFPPETSPRLAPVPIL